MSFDDIAAKMKAKRAAQQDPEEDKPFDFEHSYHIRGKMLGVLLRDARMSAARTIEDCARLLRVPTQTVEAWEYGEAVPSLPQLELLAYYLDVPVSHFWGAETLKSSRSETSDKQPEFINLRNRMIGGMLRQSREEAEVSYEEISEASGIPIETLKQYEMGDVPIPMHELSVLASQVKRNVKYFLETESQIGELLEQREAWKHFSSLPEDVRAFASNPVNIGFIHIAVMLSQMPADRLREVGASIVDITM